MSLRFQQTIIALSIAALSGCSADCDREDASQASSPPPTVPQHLAGILNDVSLQKDSVDGHVECSCGNRSLQLLFAGHRNTDPDKQFLQSKEIAGHWHYRLGFRCDVCWKEELIFDEDFHGYNGFAATAPEAKRRPRLPFETWQCHLCGSERHRIRVSIGLDESAIGEGVSVDRWCDAYGWFDLSTVCESCGLDHMVGLRETM